METAQLGFISSEDSCFGTIAARLSGVPQITSRDGALTRIQGQEAIIPNLMKIGGMEKWPVGINERVDEVRKEINGWFGR